MRIATFFALVIILTHSLRAETIFLRDGRVISGSITSQSPKEIHLRTKEAMMVIPKSGIVRIVYDEQVSQEEIQAREEKEKVRKEKERLQRLEKERRKREEQRRKQEKLAEQKRLQQKLEQERLAQEKLEQEKLELETLEKEKLERERLEQEELEKLEQEKLAQEKLEQEKLQREILEKQAERNLEKEKLESEEAKKEQSEKSEPGLADKYNNLLTIELLLGSGEWTPDLEERRKTERTVAYAFFGGFATYADWQKKDATNYQVNMRYYRFGGFLGVSLHGTSMKPSYTGIGVIDNVAFQTSGGSFLLDSDTLDFAEFKKLEKTENSFQLGWLFPINSLTIAPYLGVARVKVDAEIDQRQFQRIVVNALPNDPQYNFHLDLEDSLSRDLNGYIMGLDLRYSLGNYTLRLDMNLRKTSGNFEAIRNDLALHLNNPFNESRRFNLTYETQNGNVVSTDRSFQLGLSYDLNELLSLEFALKRQVSTVVHKEQIRLGLSTSAGNSYFDPITGNGSSSYNGDEKSILFGLQRRVQFH